MSLIGSCAISANAHTPTDRCWGRPRAACGRVSWDPQEAVRIPGEGWVQASFGPLDIGIDTPISSVPHQQYFDTSFCVEKDAWRGGTSGSGPRARL